MLNMYPDPASPSCHWSFPYCEPFSHSRWLNLSHWDVSTWSGLWLTKHVPLKMVLDHSSVSFNVSKSDVKIGNDMHLVGKIQMSQLVNTNVTIGKQKCHNMQVYDRSIWASLINLWTNKPMHWWIDWQLGRPTYDFETISYGFTTSWLSQAKLWCVQQQKNMSTVTTVMS